MSRSQLRRGGLARFGLARFSLARFGLVGAVLAIGLSVGVLSGCASRPAVPGSSASSSSDERAGPNAAANAVPEPAQCQRWQCVRQTEISIGGGRTVSLWLSGAPATVQPWDRRPVLELAVDGTATQWLITPAPQSVATRGSLVCATGGPEVTCAVTAPIGAHSGYGLIVALRGDSLVSSAAWLVRAAGEVTAADLDQDGYVDLAGLDSDWTPDYASGHNYWQTYRFTGAGLVSTGCSAALATYPSAGPTHFFTGVCPVEQ